jgi:CRP-like cAMP-binding protein
MKCHRHLSAKWKIDKCLKEKMNYFKKRQINLGKATKNISFKNGKMYNIGKACSKKDTNRRGMRTILNQVMEVMEILEKEKKIYEIFKSCPYYLLKRIKVKQYEAGEFVRNQGQIYEQLYVIVEGIVEVYVESEQGKRFYFASYDKGCFVGELEIFSRRPYMCQVEAIGPLKTLEISREDFLELLQCDHRFHNYYTTFINNEHYNSMQEMCINMLYTLKQRLCLHLINNVKLKGTKHTMLNAEAIAERMGVTTRSVHRILKELKEKGIIDIRKSNVEILDMERLVLEKDEK